MPEMGQFRIVPTPLGPRMVTVPGGSPAAPSPLSSGQIEALVDQAIERLRRDDPQLTEDRAQSLRRELARILQDMQEGRLVTLRERGLVEQFLPSGTLQTLGPQRYLEQIVQRIVGADIHARQRLLTQQEVEFLVRSLDLPAGATTRFVRVGGARVLVAVNGGEVVPLAFEQAGGWRWSPRAPAASMQAAIRQAAEQQGLLASQRLLSGTSPTNVRVGASAYSALRPFVPPDLASLERSPQWRRIVELLWQGMDPETVASMEPDAAGHLIRAIAAARGGDEAAARRTLMRAMGYVRGQARWHHEFRDELARQIAAGRSREELEQIFAQAAEALAEVGMEPDAAREFVRQEIAFGLELERRVRQLRARMAQQAGEPAQELFEQQVRAFSDALEQAIAEALPADTFEEGRFASLLAGIDEGAPPEMLESVIDVTQERLVRWELEHLEPMSRIQWRLHRLADMLLERGDDMQAARAAAGEAAALYAELLKRIPRGVRTGDLPAFVPFEIETAEDIRRLAFELRNQALQIGRHSAAVRRIWDVRQELSNLLDALYELRNMAYQTEPKLAESATEAWAERTRRWRRLLDEHERATSEIIERELLGAELREEVMRELARRDIRYGVPPADVVRILTEVGATEPRPIEPPTIPGVEVRRASEIVPTDTTMPESLFEELEQARRMGAYVRPEGSAILYRIAELDPQRGARLEPLTVRPEAIEVRIPFTADELRRLSEAATPDLPDEALRSFAEQALPRPSVLPVAGQQGRVFLDIESLRAHLRSQSMDDLVDVAALLRLEGGPLLTHRFVWETLAHSAPWAVFGRERTDVEEAVQNMAAAIWEAISEPRLEGLQDERLAQALHPSIMRRFLREAIEPGFDLGPLSPQERGMYVGVAKLLEEAAKIEGVADIAELSEEQIRRARDHLIRAYEGLRESADAQGAPKLAFDLGYMHPLVDRRRMSDELFMRIARDVQQRIRRVSLDAPTVGYRVGQQDEDLARLADLEDARRRLEEAGLSAEARDLLTEPELEALEEQERLMPRLEMPEPVAAESVEQAVEQRLLPSDALRERLAGLQLPDEAQEALIELQQRLSRIDEERAFIAGLPRAARRAYEQALRDLDDAARRAVRQTVRNLERLTGSQLSAMVAVQSTLGLDVLREGFTAEELQRAIARVSPTLTAQSLQDLGAAMQALGIESLPVVVRTEQGPISGSLVRLSGGDVVVQLPNQLRLAIEGLVEPMQLTPDALGRAQIVAPLSFREPTRPVVFGQAEAPFVASLGADPDALVRLSARSTQAVAQDPGVALQNLQRLREGAPGLVFDIETTTLPEALPVDAEGRAISEALSLTAIEYQPVVVRGGRLVAEEAPTRWLVQLPASTRAYVENLLGRTDLTDAERQILVNLAKFVDHDILSVDLAALDESARAAFDERLRQQARVALDLLDAEGISQEQAIRELQEALRGRVAIGVNITGFDLPVLEQLSWRVRAEDTIRAYEAVTGRIALEDQLIAEQVPVRPVLERAMQEGPEAVQRAVRELSGIVRGLDVTEASRRELLRALRGASFAATPAIELRFLQEWAGLGGAGHSLEAMIGALFGATSPQMQAYQAAAHVWDVEATTQVLGGLLERLGEGPTPEPLRPGDFLAVAEAIGRGRTSAIVPRGAYRLEAIGRASRVIGRGQAGWAARLVPIDGGRAVTLQVPTHAELQYLLARHTSRLSDEQAAQAFQAFVQSDDVNRAMNRALQSARSIRFYMARDVVGFGDTTPEQAVIEAAQDIFDQVRQGRSLAQQPLTPGEQVILGSYLQLPEGARTAAQVRQALPATPRQAARQAQVGAILSGGTGEAVRPFLEQVEALQASGVWSRREARQATRRFLDELKARGFVERRKAPYLVDLGRIVLDQDGRSTTVHVRVGALNERQAIRSFWRAAAELTVAGGMSRREAVGMLLGHLRDQGIEAATLSQAAASVVAQARAGRLPLAEVEDWSAGVMAGVDVSDPAQVAARMREIRQMGREIIREVDQARRQAWQAYEKQLAAYRENPRGEPPPVRPDYAPPPDELTWRRYRLVRQAQRELADRPVLGAALRFERGGRPYLEPGMAGQLAYLEDLYVPLTTDGGITLIDDLIGQAEQVRQDILQLRGQAQVDQQRLKELYRQRATLYRQLEDLALEGGEPIRSRVLQYLGWDEASPLEQTLITRGTFAGMRLGEIPEQAVRGPIRAELSAAVPTWLRSTRTRRMGERAQRFMEQQAAAQAAQASASAAGAATAQAGRRAARQAQAAAEAAARAGREAADQTARTMTRGALEQLMDEARRRSRDVLRELSDVVDMRALKFIGGLALAGFAFRQLTRKDTMLDEPAWKAGRAPAPPPTIEVIPAQQPTAMERRGLSVRIRGRSERYDETRLRPILEESLRSSLGVPVQAHVQVQDDRSRLTSEWVDSVVSQLIEQGYISHM